MLGSRFPAIKYLFGCFTLRFELLLVRLVLSTERSLDLLEKLIHIGCTTNVFCMHDQPCRVVHHTLHVAARMAGSTTMHQCIVRVGQLDMLSSDFTPSSLKRAGPSPVG